RWPGIHVHLHRPEQLRQYGRHPGLFVQSDQHRRRGPGRIHAGYQDGTDAICSPDATGRSDQYKLQSEIIAPGAGSLPLPLPIHVITVFNPFGRVLDTAENEMRNDVLSESLSIRGLEFRPVLGRSPDSNWPEPSFAVHGLSRVEACKLARRLGQRAVFELDADEFRVVSGGGGVRKQGQRNK
ncbi:MAG TPA: hypothetical protein DIT99_12520, partial [Candidatus Latescibacteria bacterium]|nr:hypothetical protein [Candidatus Latescibacterota bacterium]